MLKSLHDALEQALRETLAPNPRTRTGRFRRSTEQERVRRRKRAVKSLAGWLLPLLLIGFMILFWRDVLPGAELEDLVSGRATKPFVYRHLVPAMIGVFSPGPDWYAPVGFILVVAFLAGYAFFLRSWVRLPRLALLSCALLFINGGFVYDAATLFFSLLICTLILKRRLVWLLLVFPLASLNRETTVLFLVPLVLYHGRDALKVSTALFGQWAAVRFLLTAMFQANPGSPAVWQLARRMDLLAQDPFGFLALWSVPVLFLVAGYGGWRGHSRFVRACWPLPLAFYGAFFLFGCTAEWRVFAEVHAVLFLMIEQSLSYKKGECHHEKVVSEPA